MKKLVLLALSLTFSILSYAQMTIVVAFPPGGDTDVLARLFATNLSKKTGKSVVIDNRPGAAGITGTLHAMNAPADGSVIMLAPSTLITAPLVNPKVAAYDPVADFTPIMQISGHGMFAVISSSTGITNIKELIAASKEGKITAYATAGSGSPMNIVGEAFNKKAGTELQHIAYRGNAQVVTNILGNHTPFSWITPLPVIPHVESGKITMLAIASKKRSQFYPNVPTLEEQGIKDIYVESWLGFVGPKGMSRSVQMEINAALHEVINMPEVQERMRALALVPVGSSPEQFRETLVRETERFKKILSSVEVKVD